MYKTRWSLFQVLHTTLHVLKQFRKSVGLCQAFYKYRRDVVIKLLHRQKQLFSFQNEQFQYFLTHI